MDTLSSVTSSVTQPVANVAGTILGKIPCVDYSNRVLSINLVSACGALALCIIIIIVILLIWRSWSCSKEIELAAKNAMLKCPKCPVCDLKSLGYVGPVTLDGDHKLKSGESAERNYNMTCFDTMHLGYSANKCQ